MYMIHEMYINFSILQVFTLEVILLLHELMVLAKGLVQVITLHLVDFVKESEFIGLNNVSFFCAIELLLNWSVPKLHLDTVVIISFLN